MKKRFGNTLTSIRGGIFATGILGLIAGAIGLVAAYTHGTLARTSPVLLVLFFLPTGGFTLACLPTLAFSIQIDGERIRHVLLDRFILSDLPVNEFDRFETIVGPFGAVIHFRDGRVIRFIGAHLGILSSLRKELQRLKKRAGR